nr:PH domain-containing protein [Spirosoma luteum]
MTTRYKLDKNTLTIQSGLFFHKALPIASIKKIIETRTLLVHPLSRWIELN